jgi:D-aspartate ligase
MPRSEPGASAGAARIRCCHTDAMAKSAHPVRDLPEAILLSPTDAALAVARSLHPRGVPVAMVGQRCWQMRTRRATSHILPALAQDPESWVAFLAELGRDRDGVLIPGSDRAVEFLVRQRSRIPDRLRSFESPDSAHLRLMDKLALYDLAASENVRFPWTLRLRSRAELEKVADEATYPCLLKPAVAHEWRRLFGAWRVFLLRDRDELLRQAGPGLDAGLELMITEYVPGDDRHLEGVTVVRAGDGSYPLAYGRRKLRQYPPGFGSVSLFETADVPEMMALATRLLDASGFVGIAAVEAKRHAETGELVLIEVNVRIPQGFTLGDASGIDGSWRLYATLAGVPLPPRPSQRNGVKVIAPDLEPRAAMATLVQRQATLRQVLRSYRGVRDLSGLSLRDPGPLLALSARELGRVTRFVRRRTRFQRQTRPGAAIEDREAS